MGTSAYPITKQIIYLLLMMCGQWFNWIPSADNFSGWSVIDTKLINNLSEDHNLKIYENKPNFTHGITSLLYSTTSSDDISAKY